MTFIPAIHAMPLALSNSALKGLGAVPDNLQQFVQPALDKIKNFPMATIYFREGLAMMLQNDYKGISKMLRHAYFPDSPMHQSVKRIYDKVVAKWKEKGGEDWVLREVILNGLGNADGRFPKVTGTKGSNLPTPPAPPTNLGALPVVPDELKSTLKAAILDFIDKNEGNLAWAIRVSQFTPDVRRKKFGINQIQSNLIDEMKKDLLPQVWAVGITGTEWNNAVSAWASKNGYTAQKGFGIPPTNTAVISEVSNFVEGTVVDLASVAQATQVATTQATQAMTSATQVATTEETTSNTTKYVAAGIGLLTVGFLFKDKIMSMFKGGKGKKTEGSKSKGEGLGSTKGSTGHKPKKHKPKGHKSVTV